MRHSCRASCVLSASAPGQRPGACQATTHQRHSGILHALRDDLLRTPRKTPGHKHLLHMACVPPRCHPPEGGARFYIRKVSIPWSPLRNRTVDLLLTMNGRTVPLPQVERLTRQNASTGQRALTLDRPSRAPFATQSATQIDLVLIHRRSAASQVGAFPRCPRSRGRQGRIPFIRRNGSERLAEGITWTQNPGRTP